MQPHGFGKFGLCSSECPHLPSDYNCCRGVIFFRIMKGLLTPELCVFEWVHLVALGGCGKQVKSTEGPTYTFA